MEAEKSALNETGPAPMQAACITFNIKNGEENRFPLGKFRETLRILEVPLTPIVIVKWLYDNVMIYITELPMI